MDPIDINLYAKLFMSLTKNRLTDGMIYAVLSVTSVALSGLAIRVIWLRNPSTGTSRLVYRELLLCLFVNDLLYGLLLFPFIAMESFLYKEPIIICPRCIMCVGMTLLFFSISAIALLAVNLRLRCSILKGNLAEKKYAWRILMATFFLFASTMSVLVSYNIRGGITFGGIAVLTVLVHFGTYHELRKRARRIAADRKRPDMENASQDGSTLKTQTMRGDCVQWINKCARTLTILGLNSCLCHALPFMAYGVFRVRLTHAQIEPILGPLLKINYFCHYFNGLIYLGFDKEAKGVMKDIFNRKKRRGARSK